MPEPTSRFAENLLGLMAWPAPHRKNLCNRHCMAGDVLLSWDEGPNRAGHFLWPADPVPFEAVARRLMMAVSMSLIVLRADEKGSRGKGTGIGFGVRRIGLRQSDYSINARGVSLREP